ncbi:MAG: ABC transporter substrate-binding protein [Sulfolobaceae archaeon]
MSIYQYVWDFGNGKRLTVNANESTYLPIINPVNVTYSSPGLYPIKLTLVTKNMSSGATYNLSVIYTIAVTGGGKSYSLYSFKGNVPNPSVITVVENVPGGPFSFDPHIDYESVGFEVISNIIGTLLIYNGSHTDSFIPFIAEEIPTVENGGIKDNYTTYTFKIRSGLYFSNGDPITAYDVWYSMIRALLFVGGTPGTGDWILAQYLIPGATIGVPIVTEQNKEEAFKLIMNAVTYDNKTNTVTFHLIKPTPPSLFFTAIADPLCAGILDAKWLQQVGAGITFTPDGFLKYENYSIEGNYNDQVRNNPVASGPYMIKEYVPGQYVILQPNPYFPGVPGVPKPNTTVIIQWVKDPQTAFNLFISGQADIVTQLPTNYIAALKPYVAQGQAAIYQFPTLSEFFFVFNINIDVNGLKKINPNYNIPPDYFANLYVRKAFAYAFNYTNYLDNILGNKKYGFQFGNGYAGVIIPGLPYYTPPEQITSDLPKFNLTYAKELMIKSGLYNVSVYFPIIVPSGDTVDYAAAQMWAQALQQIDPNIRAEPLYMPFSQIISYQVPGQNPLPIYYLGWIADYPHPSDFVDAMYKENGTYPAPDGWYVSYLEKLGYTDQANLYKQLNDLIIKADSATDPTLAKQLYANVTKIALELYMYVYVVQPNAFWIVKPYMKGYKGDITYQENPMIGGAGDSLFYWWVKG